jgi:hypothetical protein
MYGSICTSSTPDAPPDTTPAKRKKYRAWGLAMNSLLRMMTLALLYAMLIRRDTAQESYFGSRVRVLKNRREDDERVERLEKVG